MERSITRKRTLFNVLLIGLIFLAFCAGGAFSQRKSPKPTPTPRDLIRKSADVYPERSRVALVIGNSAYQVGRLKNPVNDANAMTTTLRGVGFDVVSRTDATLSSMRQAIGEFSRKVQSEGVRLFYFAGHGVQANGKNYLIPVDAKIERLSDLSLQAIENPDSVGLFFARRHIRVPSRQAAKYGADPESANGDSNSGFAEPDVDPAREPIDRRLRHHRSQL
ncbi:MAG: caspase family protein [Acidobacteria bacterium]|nr:caspase family protein [Acidobacteriota bacterium]